MREVESVKADIARDLREEQTFRPTAILLVERDGAWLVDPTRAGGLTLLDPILPQILESFVGRPRTIDAYAAYCAVARTDPGDILPTNVLEECAAYGTTRGRFALQIVGHRALLSFGAATEQACLSAGAVSNVQRSEQSGHWDLTATARRKPVLCRTLIKALNPAQVPAPEMSIDDFVSRQEVLLELGCLHPNPQDAAAGLHLSRHPACPFFGMSRGTPIGRHYLNQFIAESRDGIRGRTLEIGGLPLNRQRYRLAQAAPFVTVDLNENSGADVVGDVHDRSLFQPGSFDAILAFNVLEHCPDPRRVVDNVHAWLKPDGLFLCMVPNAQRVHGAPRDYWRPLPDGVASLVAAFQQIEIRAFGNLATTIASLRGLAAEEIGAELFTWHDERYPVATCVRARKTAQAPSGIAPGP